MDEELWELLHDGSITNVDHVPPGDVRLTLTIEYLRQMFDGVGTSIRVYLTGCDVLTYVPYDGSPPITDLRQLAGAELSFICAASDDGMIKVSCGYGDLCLRYASARLDLDDEMSITRAELEDAASRYWDAFGSSDAPN